MHEWVGVRLCQFVWASVGVGGCGYGRMWANVGECVHMGGVYRYDTSGLLCVAWTEGGWRQGWVVHNTNTNTNNSIIRISHRCASGMCACAKGIESSVG
jgi:hypothetical protein